MYFIQYVPGALYRGVKRPELEADHPPPSSVEVNVWSLSPLTIHFHGLVFRQMGSFIKQ